MLRTGTLSRGGVSRRSVLLGAAGAVGVVSAACVPGQPGTSVSTAPVTIEMWHPWDTTREPLFKQVVADFQKLYPHITVNAVVTPSTELITKTLAATAAGTAPPIAYLERADFLGYALKKVIDPLDTLIKQEKMAVSEYYEGDIRSGDV